MSKEADIKKAAGQHIEMEEFFVGDFTLRGKKTEMPPAGENGSDPEMKDKSAALKKIALEIAASKQCAELAEQRTQTVSGEGNCDAELVFIGEAPGADEDKQGRPFVGRAGKKLDEIIAAMKLKREDVFITNILKCRPPGNRDPKPDEIVACLPYLLRQLEVIRPKIIVALGAHAAKTLLNTNEPIGKLRGHFHEFRTSEDAEPIMLMPTYHPSYLVRNYTPENRKRVWEDMKKVMAELSN